MLAPVSAPEISDDQAEAWWEVVVPNSAHVISYVVLTIGAGFLQVPLKQRLWLLLALFAHGVLMELLQPYFERTADISDAAYDLLGISLGLLLGRRFWFAD